MDAPQPHVVATALQTLTQALPQVPDHGALQRAALQLLRTHSDAGVQGRALELLGALGKKTQDVLRALLSALKNPSPHVRSEACAALARLRHVPAIHSLVGLVDDPSDNRFEYVVPTLDGAPERITLSASPWGSVADAALGSMRALSAGKLELGRIDPKEPTRSITQNAQLAKLWYQKHKSKLPKAEPGPEATP
jgi:hypothetical protein